MQDRSKMINLALRVIALLLSAASLILGFWELGSLYSQITLLGLAVLALALASFQQTWS